TKGLILTLCLLVVFVTKAATIKGNGNTTTQEFKIDNYESIEVGGNISTENKLFGFKKQDSKKIKYSQQSGTSTLKITLDENLFPYLDIRSSNGTLFIRTKNRNKIVPTQLLILTSSDKLRKVSISGALDFIIDSPLHSDELNISVSGAGDIIMEKQAELGIVRFSISGAGDAKAGNLICKEFEGKISGVGDFDLKGKADKARFSVSGAGDVNAYLFHVKNATVSVSGAGDVEVYTSETLDASVSGIGDISYKGNAKVNRHKSGLGSIQKEN
ncbi:MAG: DUF2807 domain-containing protein, partial [Massilibacteroides sp.]|nr:DUF2807 domain-containing protein [Massilibacteroides sp.]